MTQSTHNARNDELEVIFSNHAKWLETSGSEGVRADFSNQTCNEEGFQGKDLRMAIFAKSICVEANFQGSRLDDADFTGANLTGAIFYGASLVRAKLIGSMLSEAEFNKKSSLINANLNKADCHATNFGGADLTGAKFKKANLTEVNGELSIFNGCNFSRADLSDGVLRGAKLIEADFRMANLKRCSFSRAILTEADFSGADLREIRNNHPIERRFAILGSSIIPFDSNTIYRTKFTNGVTDHWSLLRRKYTGSMLSFNMLFLILFLLPYFGQTFFWIAVNRAEARAASAITRPLNKVISHLQNSTDEKAKVWVTRTRQLLIKIENLGYFSVAKELQNLIDEGLDILYTIKSEYSVMLAGELQLILPSLRAMLGWDLEEWRLWQLLIGCNLGAGYVAITVLIILYNISRGILTYMVGPLRDEEVRTQMTPAINDYGYLFYIHRLNVLLIAVSVVSTLIFIWNAYHWLGLKVYIPIAVPV